MVWDGILLMFWGRVQGMIEHKILFMGHRQEGLGHCCYTLFRCSKMCSVAVGALANEL